MTEFIISSFTLNQCAVNFFLDNFFSKFFFRQIFLPLTIHYLLVIFHYSLFIFPNHSKTDFAWYVEKSK